MEDFPRTLGEFEYRFGNNQACRQYLFALRWPQGFVCPRCGAGDAWVMQRELWLCRHCRHQTSVTAGTIFQDSHLPLTTWFRAMWYVTTQKNGVSALGLQRVLGLGSYKTAWSLLHRLRRAMVRPGRDRLHGLIEVDEAYWGGVEEGLVGRLTQDKAVIGVGAEVDGQKIGRIRLRRLADASQDSLHGFVTQAIEPGSTVRTDGWVGYLGLKGYHHDRQIQSHQPPGDHLLPHVHRVVSLLKRWLMGTHQGSVGLRHLDYYLDEFTFRFNRRTSASRGKLFYRLSQQAMQVDAAPFTTLINPPPLGGG